MNKIIQETEVVDKAIAATHRVRQPSWAAHCMALGINMDEAEEEAERERRRPTIRVKTPAYDFKPTPLCVVIPPQARTPVAPSPLKVQPVVEELDLNWEG